MVSRRVFLIAGLVAPVVALGGSIKAATSWRPVVVGRFAKSVSDESNSASVFASGHFVQIYQDGSFLFDLQKGGLTKLPFHSNQNGFADGFLWQWSFSDPPKGLTVHGLGIYPAPRLSDVAGSGSYASAVRIRPGLNLVELLTSYRFFRWNLKSHKLELATQISRYGEVTALSQDGETVINAKDDSVDWVSSRTGRVLKTVSTRDTSRFERLCLSEHGAYAIYDAPGRTGAIPQHIVETRSGHILWSFYTEFPVQNFALSSDERLLALPLPPQHVWQIRELATGKIVRTLPLVAGTQGGGFSPDGTKLYSVANGVLYRQRVL